MALSHIYSTKRELQEFPEGLQSLTIKLMAYQFTVVYIPGKINFIADYLSRNPIEWGMQEDYVWPTIQDRNGKLVPVENVVRRAVETISKRREEDPSLQFIKDAALSDNQYAVILEAKEKNLTQAEIKLLPQDHPARAVGNIWEHLGLLGDSILLTYDITRLVVPKDARR